MAQTKIKSGQLDLSGAAHGTDGQALLSNADGTMRWGDIQVAGPGYTSLDYPGATTALNAAGGQTLIINGSGYDANTTVTFGTTSVSAISVLSATQLSVTTPALANGTYDLVLGNAAGGTTTQSNVIIYNATPSWTTAAGSLGSVVKDTTANFTVAATEPDGGAITYAVTSGALPTGLSLNTSSGAITGTATPSISSNTTYNFTITATDNENQTNARAFSIEVTVPLPSERFEVITYTGNGGTQKIEGGKILRGAVFNGSNSTITIPDSSIFDFVNATSMSFFVNRNTTNRDFIIDKANGGSGSYGWQLEYFGTTKGYQFQIHNTSNGVISNLETGANSTTGNWEHIVVTHNGSGEFKIYFNGVLKATQTLSGTVSTNTGDVKIGTYQLSSGFEFDGKLDQLRFFNKALSSSEVTTLYQEDDYTSTTKSTTDIFSDGSGVTLYEFETNANATDSVTEIAFDSTINTSSIAYTVNNRKIAGNTGGSYASTRVTESKSSGKWYFEMYYDNSSYFPSSRGGLGLLCPTCTMTTYLGGTSQDEWAVFNGGNVINNGSSVHNESLGDFSIGNVIMCALDLDNQKVYFGKNGNWFNSANPSNGTNSFTLSGSEYYAAGWVYNTSDQLTFRFREGDFAYTVPTGFSAYSETNYDGTASNVAFKEGTKFSPDLVWIKQRTGSVANHVIFDSIRGVHKQLGANTTSSEIDRTSTDKGVTSFNSNGFTVKDTSAGDYEINGPSGGTYSGNGSYVAWCWKAGGSSTSSNSDGTITTNISANVAAGFNIISYAGNGTADSTIGHGLGQQVKLAFFKNRTTGSTYWYVYSDELSGSTYNLYLNASSAQTADNVLRGGNTTTIQISNSTAVNATSNNYICYAFANIDSYQKIGKYTGNGSTNGTIVETGFEPAFLMIKRIDSSANWRILDNERSLSNPRDKELYPNLSNVEGDYDAIDFLSNGFQNISTDSSYNANGGTYLYLAIAADPDITQPTQANSFDVVTYTGNGSTQDIETDFKPDLVWIKERTNASHHALFDSVRGNQYLISPNQTISQIDQSANPALESFDINGFTVDQTNTSNYYVNRSSQTYVAWCFKAGSHDDNLPEINTEGSIDSIVSVNDAAGFSIVKYTGTGANATVGHGLSNPPELIFVKTLDSVDNWMVLSTAVGSEKKAALNADVAFDDDSLPWNSTDPTSSVFSVGTKPATNASGDKFIAYCWYSVTGHSKIGSYEGNNDSGDQSITGLGFQPRFLLLKNADDTGRWVIIDSVRGNDEELYPNLSNVESNEPNRTTLDSDGFTVRSGRYNNNGDTFIYMAFK
jgi:hypothetical protein